MTESQWKRLRIEGNEYFFRKECKARTYKVVLTNLKRVWIREMEEDEIASLCQKLNPLIECESGLLIHKAFSTLESLATPPVKENGEPSFHELNLRLMDEDIVLKLKTRLEGGLPFKFELSLRCQNEEIFFEEVMLTFLSAMEELIARQDALCDLLEKKDIEIEEYQLEGARITRRNVETEKFLKGDFVQKCHNSQSSLVSHGTLDVLRVVLKNKFSREAQDTPKNITSPLETVSGHAQPPEFDSEIASEDYKKEPSGRPQVKMTVKKPSKKIKLNL